MILRTRKGIEFRVSDDINPELFKRPWYASRHEGNYYIRRVIRYRDATGASRRRTEYLHRLIVDCPPGWTVEHIDGDTLNNERGNLKIVSVQENTRLMWERRCSA